MRATAASVLLEIDLEQNTVVIRRPGVWAGFLNEGDTAPLDSFPTQLAEAKLAPQDRSALIQALSSAHLSTLFRTDGGSHSFGLQAAGETGAFISFSCKIFRSGAKLHCLIQPSGSPRQGDHDALTGLLSQHAAEHAVRDYLETAAPGARGSCLVIQLAAEQDGLHLRKAMRLVAETLRKNLPASAITGRYGDHAFLVFLSRGTHDIVTTSANALADQVHSRYPDISVQVGASCYPQDAADLRGLVSCADAALLHLKRTGNMNFCWYEGSFSIAPAAPAPDTGTLHSRRRSLRRRVIQFFHTYTRSIIIISGAVIILSAVLGLFCSAYLSHLKTMVQEESAGYLFEITSQISQNVQTMIESNLTSLHLLGDSAAAGSGGTLSGAQSVIREQQNELPGIPFTTIGLLDTKGYWYMNGEKKSYPDMSEPVSRVILEHQNMMSTAQRIDGVEYIVFMAPVRETVLDGVKIAGIIGAIDLGAMHDVISLDAFDKEGYSYIVDRDGAVVVRPQQSALAVDSYNIMSALDESALLDGRSASQIRGDLKNGRSGQVRYQHGTTDKLMTYMPVGIGDWYLLTVIPAHTATAKSDAFFRLTLFACIIISLLFLVLLLLVFLTNLRSRENLKRLAYLDDVTGGCNRRRFEQDAARQMTLHRGDYSIIYVNIEKFKFLNEQLGRLKADQLLRILYASIEQDLSSSEHLARIMADHFGVLLHTHSTPEIMDRLARWTGTCADMLSHLDPPCSAVLTYGIYPVTESAPYDIAGLLDRANLARKSLRTVVPGAVNAAVYDNALRQKLQWEQSLESRMEQALETKEFSMYLQPKYDLATGSICGLEALTRWEIPGRGTVYPDTFIPLFERNGFIVKLDCYIFEQACRFIRRMIDEGRRPVCISVNLSRAHLDDTDFLQEYQRIWESSGIPARYIELEFTETMIYDCMEQLSSVIEEIHKIGFRCSMDDFGSGYSSLNMLRSIDVDIIKLDRNFFGPQDVSESRGLVIIKNVIHLAKELDMLVVAEGVEEKWQADCLKCFGCDMVQGYYFARPLPEDEIAKML